MSLFGDLDAASIPSNPFWIEQGDYTGEVSKAEYKTDRDRRQLHLEYTIVDDESRFNGKKVSQYYTLVPVDMTSADLELLPKDEKDKILKTLSSLKRTLCGNSANNKQRGLNVSQEELQDKNWDPNTLVGRQIQFGIGNSGDENQYVSVRWVNTVE